MVGSGEEKYSRNQDYNDKKKKVKKKNKIEKRRSWAGMRGTLSCPFFCFFAFILFAIVMMIGLFFFPFFLFITTTRDELFGGVLLDKVSRDQHVLFMYSRRYCSVCRNG